MGVYLNPKSILFEEAVSSEIYVDKTALLQYTNKVINTQDKFLCVSSPRRFGKTTSVSMLVAYYTAGYNSEQLFRNLMISGVPSFHIHLNQYNVIRLDIYNLRSNYVPANNSDLSETSSGGKEDAPDSYRFSAFLTYVEQELLRELNSAFPDILRNFSGTFAKAIQVISSTMDNHRFIFVIDEWDCLFRTDPDNSTLQKRYIRFLSSFLKGSAAEECISLAYMTGILPIKKYGIHSALTNFDEISMLTPHPLEACIGFTHEEVQNLCKKHSTSLSRMEQWYDGYSFPKVGAIYNPKSVVSAIRKRIFKNYWTTTETYQALQKYIDMDLDGILEAITLLISGSSVPVNPLYFQNDMVSIHTKDDVLTLLVHLGYLSFCAVDPDDQEISASITNNDLAALTHCDITSEYGLVRIPNREIREEFQRAMKGERWKPVQDSLALANGVLLATWNLDGNTVAESVARVHLNFSSLFDYNNDQALRCIITLAYYTAQNYYLVSYEDHAGRGRADVVFVPRVNSDKPAMIVELKWNRSADSAINQIMKKQYAGKLMEYSRILLVGINYDPETNEHQCVIQPWGT